MLPGRVVREAPTASDVLAGSPGRLQSIDLTPANYGDLQTSGIDLDASLRVTSGRARLNLDLAVSRVAEYRSRDMNPVLPLERVGIANARGTIPEWRVIGTIGGTLSRFGASATTTFTPSYQDADFVDGPLDRRIGAQILVDLQASIELPAEGSALLADSTVTVGARNLLDACPSFARAGASLGYDLSQSELTCRFVYLRLRSRF